jgi:hypothetical protein
MAVLTGGRNARNMNWSRPRGTMAIMSDLGASFIRRGTDDEHGALRVSHNSSRNAAEQHPPESSVGFGADNDQIHLPSVRIFNNLCLRVAFNRFRLGGETGLTQVGGSCRRCNRPTKIFPALNTAHWEHA